MFRQHVAQFNACVPYAGVSPDSRVDAAVLPVLFTLLPLPQPLGITVAPPSAKVSLRRVNVTRLLDREALTHVSCACPPGIDAA